MRGGSVSFAAVVGVVDAGVAVSLSEVVVLNLTEMRVLRERGWDVVVEEAGQRGWSLRGLEGLLWVVEGVREGTQKEGRVGLEDCEVPRG